ncbi:hypothetical protein WFZ86_19930, partial [Flavobacterium sp. N6]
SVRTLTVNDNGTNQTINYSVRDGNGCITAGTAIILNRLNPPTDLSFANASVTCTSPTTSVTLTATNGVGALQYETIAPSVVILPKQTSNVFAGLASGNYTFRVTDTNGCYYTESYEIIPVVPIVIAGNVTSNVDCRGNSTGDATFTVSGNATVGAYTYVLTAGTLGTGTLTQSGNTLTLTNVVAGNYTIRVTDTATGCFADASVTITQPAAALSITSAIATNVNCNNDNSQITVTAAGGTTNYGYAAVVSGATAPTVFASSSIVTVDTNSASNLVWDVYVKDANGCTIIRTVTVINDPLPSITSVTVPNQCSASGSTFTITATPSATSLTPLTYGIGGPTGTFQTSPTFTVSAGTYTVYIKDKNGCVVAAPVPTIVYPQLTSSAAVTKTLDCSASPDAVITTTITGGRAPFTYTVQKGTGTPVSGGPASASLTFTTSVSNANADTYTFVITDANGCQATTSTTVTAITNPTVAATPTMVSCNGGSNGSVVLAGSGGSGGYTYSNNATSGFTSTATFSGLSASATPYTFYVKDSKGCTGSIAVTITQPTALVVSASATAFSCNATNVKQSATVTINVPTTGTSPYVYSFNGGAYSSVRTLTVNDNGTNQTINYSVRDGNGCITAGTAIILNRLNPPTIATITNTPIYCVPVSSTTSTVTVPVTAGTGVGTLTYTITSPASATTNITGATTGVFTGLTAGTYTFKVTDANDCFATKSHTVPAVTPIAVTATKLTDVDCFGNTTGSARFTVTGFSSTGNYNITVSSTPASLPYTLSPTGDVRTLTGLVAGTYTFSVTDNTTGCTDSKSVIISQPSSALALNLVSNKNANCNVATARVEVIAAGGTPSYTYAFVQNNIAPLATDYTASAIANLNPLTNLNWDVWVKDSKGCTFKLDVAIVTDPQPTVTATAIGQCLGVGSYTITASGVGGLAPLEYSINGGASYQSGTTFVVTTAGSYTIKVKDANGCTDDSLPVVVAPQLTLNAVLNKDITCNPAPTAASITLTPTGGSGTFTYSASPNTGTFAGTVFTTSTAGTYTFTVTDTTTGCTYTTTTAIAVTTPVNPVIDDVALPGNDGVSQTASINCNGDDTAAIAIAIDNTKGQSPYVFNVFNTTTGINYGTQTSGLSAGDYLVTVTDAKGCTDTEPITITEPAPIAVLHTTVPITCNGAGISKGSVIVQSVTGGVGPYNYFVNGVNGYNESELNNFGSTSFKFDVVDFGIYQINVVDSNGCSVLIQNVKVASPPDDLDISVIPPPADCSAPGSAVVAVGSSPTSTIGAGPFYFSIYTGTAPVYPAGTWLPEDAPGSKQTTFANLIPGVTYTFVVFDADVANGGTGTGCYYYETSTIPIPTNSTITVNPLTPNNITCKGAADGNVTFTMNHTYSVATPVTYQIYNSQSVTPVGAAVAAVIPATGSLVVNNFGTLPFGSYFVLVTETGVATHSGCSISSARFDITESAIDLSLTAQKIKKVNCNEDGIIATFASNGTGPYTYQYLLATDPAPTAGAAGWISATTFATSTTGNYVVYVKDAYGCIKTAPVTLDADAAPTVTPPVAPICYDGTAFTITFSGTVDPAIAGLPTYSVNGSAFQSSPSFTFNAAGTYNLVIKDGNNCTANVDYVVHPKLELSAAVTKTLDCTATPNATITLTTIGGNTTPAANYTYEVNFNGGGFVAATNPYTATTAGTYDFRVTDANNATTCQTTTSIVLDPIPTTVFTTTQTNVSCNGGTDGTITVNVTAGEGPYEYQLDAGVFQTSNQFTGLAAGTTYVVTVRNAKQCTLASLPITIAEPSALSAGSLLTTPLSCGAGNVAQTATVTVNGIGGTAPYEYSFDNGTSYSTTNTYQSNVGITFDVLVKDAKGCVYTLSNGVNIPALVPPTNMDINGTPVYCLPVASQTSTVTISNVQNGVGTFTYQIISPLAAIINNGTNAVFTGLTPDTYVFEVTDANGCKYQESYTVAPVTPIAIVGALVNDISCDASNGTTNNGSASFTVT